MFCKTEHSDYFLKTMSVVIWVWRHMWVGMVSLSLPFNWTCYVVDVDKDTSLTEPPSSEFSISEIT